MNDYLKIWNETMLLLKEEIDEKAYNDLFANTKEIAKVNDNIVYMIVQNNWLKTRIETNYLNYINTLVKHVTDQPVKFKMISSDDVKNDKIEDTFKSRRNITRVLSPLYTFETFQVGESNRFALLAAMKVAQNTEKVYNPLYIFGDVGVGKTHLMSAIGNYIQDHDLNANVVYISSQKFVEDYFLATRSKTINIEDFYEKYNNADLLLVDDIQFLEGAQKSQEEFFKIFDTLVNNNKQIVITSDKPANELKNVMARLKARFNWGLTVNISKPDEKLCISVLKNKLVGMMEDPSQVPEEVLTLLASYFKDNIRDLEGALRTFITYCSLMSLPFNENSFNMAFEKVLPKEAIAEKESTTNISQVKECVCRYFNILEEDIDGSSRKAQIVYARHIIMYILKNNYDLSLKSIGAGLGNRDHTTVLHGIDKITDALSNDQMTKNDVDIISKKCYNFYIINFGGFIHGKERTGHFGTYKRKRH